MHTAMCAHVLQHVYVEDSLGLDMLFELHSFKLIHTPQIDFKIAFRPYITL
jgi:hypothetical protein